MRYDKNAIVFPLVNEIIAHYIALFFFLKKHCSNNNCLKNSLKKWRVYQSLMAPKRLGRKIKVYYNNDAKNSSTSCLERRKAKKGMGQGNIQKQKRLWRVIPRTSCRRHADQELLLCVFNILKILQTFERTRRRNPLKFLIAMR